MHVRTVSLPARDMSLHITSHPWHSSNMPLKSSVPRGSRLPTDRPRSEPVTAGMSPLRSLLGLVVVVAGVFDARAATIFDVPANQLPDPTIIASATPFSGSYNAANVFDGIYGSGSGEYATTNAVNGDAFIDFDFGTPTTVGGFVFYQRLGGADGVTNFQLLFANAPDFSAPLSTLTFATSGTRDFTLLNDTAGARQEFVFASGIEARYVKWDVVSAVGNGYDGAAEMEFWGGVAVVPEPAMGSAALLLAVIGVRHICRRERNGRVTRPQTATRPPPPGRPRR